MQMTVLPELLDLCVLLFPTLMARAGLAHKYEEHTAAARGQKEQQQRTQKDQQGQAKGANRVTVMQQNGGSHGDVEHGR